MATLTRFKSFRSLKQNSSTKSNKSVNEIASQMTEIEKFMLLIQKKNQQKLKTAKK